MPSGPPQLTAERTDRVALRTRQRYAAVHALIDDGFGIRAIADRLELARGTVRRFARAATVEELLVNTGTGRRASLLEQFEPYMHQRWQEGCTNAAKLFEEITDRSYTGGPQILRAYLRPFRASGPDRRLPVPRSKPPSVRPVVGWIMSDPANLEPANQHRLDAILGVSPDPSVVLSWVRCVAAQQLHGRLWRRSLLISRGRLTATYGRLVQAELEALNPPACTHCSTTPSTSGGTRGHTGKAWPPSDRTEINSTATDAQLSHIRARPWGM